MRIILAVAAVYMLMHVHFPRHYRAPEPALYTASESPATDAQEPAQSGFAFGCRMVGGMLDCRAGEAH